MIEKPDPKDFFSVEIDDDSSPIFDWDKAVVTYVNTQLETFSQARQEREQTWLECWAMYFGTKEARDHLKTRVFKSVGNVNATWRHDVTTGKAFEQVETVLAYLLQAFFPNKDWFDVIPRSYGYAELAKGVKEFTRKKLYQCKFQSNWEMFLRQMLVVGSSVIALPWRVETVEWKKRVCVNKLTGKIPASYDAGLKFKEVKEEKVIYNAPAFEVLDIFDCYIDPRALSSDDSDLIRRVIKTKAEVVELINSGFYQGITAKDVVCHDPYYGGNNYARFKKNLIYKFQGFDIESGYSWNDQVELLEYWGDVIVNGTVYRDVVVTIMGTHLLRFENNPYWCGKPFIFGTYTPVPRSVSAIGVIEPGLGLLHELDIITNQRLDNLELSVDSMWLYVNDGSLQPEDIFTRPGNVFSVSQKDVLTPIQSAQNFTITYDETSVLEARIDKNAGTGNLISANAARDAERVTAAEVRATREAGGNRLSGVHKHIEETALTPFLAKMFRLFQQFVSSDEVVRVPGKNPGDFDYDAVGAEELNYEYDLVPVGADHVTDKEYDLAQRMTFLEMVSANPDMSRHINFFNFMVDLARRMGIDDIDQFIQENVTPPMEEQMALAQSQPAPTDDRDAIVQDVQQASGKVRANYVNSQMAVDGGANMLKENFGVDMNQMPMTADELATMQQQV